MGKFLFIIGEFYPLQSANSTCTTAVINKLKELNNECYVLCGGAKSSVHPYPDRPEISTIKWTNAYNLIETKYNTPVKKLYHLFVLLKRFALIYYYPILYPSKSLSFYRMAKRIIKENDIDTIVAVVRPPEAGYAGYLLAKRLPSINYIYYELDSLSNDYSSSRSPFLKLLQPVCIKKEEKWFQKYDLILHLMTNSHNYIHRESYKKSATVGIPLITSLSEKNLKTDNIANDSEVIRILYSGVLDSEYRSPKVAVETFSAISDLNIECSFYSRGDCEDFLNQTHKADTRIIPYGYVTPDVLKNEMSKAHFLLSIGNSSSDMIPSKTFSYIATGKPIIHFFSQDNDTSIEYLSKYNNSLILDSREDIKINVAKLKKFLESNIDFYIGFEKIKELFNNCTPEYTATIILNSLNKK